MKKFLIGAVGLVAMATSASAADLGARPYTKAPPPMMVAIYDWSGFYVGLNGGGGWSHKCWDLINDGFGNIPAVSDGCHDATGGTVGGQIGYRWQGQGIADPGGSTTRQRPALRAAPLDCRDIAKVHAAELARGRRAHRRTWAFVAIGSPRGGRTDASGRSWICAGIVLAVIVNVLIVRARQASSSERALCLGTATGVVHGMTAVLTKTSVDLLGHGFGTMLVHWQPYALAVLSAAAFLLNQSAFHAGHLAASLPAITVVNPVVAALLGWILFGEHLRVHGVAAVAITIVAICASVAAAISLARSPLVAPAVDTHTTA